MTGVQTCALPISFDFGNPNRRTEMMMDVDAKRLSRSTPLRQSEGAKELDETSSIGIAHQITHLIAEICTAIYTTEKGSGRTVGVLIGDFFAPMSADCGKIAIILFHHNRANVSCGVSGLALQSRIKSCRGGL